jgi:hypothetical protein
MEGWTQADIQQLCDDAEKEFMDKIGNGSIVIPNEYLSPVTVKTTVGPALDIGFVKLAKDLLLAVAEWLLTGGLSLVALKAIITALFTSLVFISDSQRCVYYHAVKLSAQLLKRNQPFTFGELKKAIRKDPCLHEDPKVHISCTFHKDEKCKIRDKDIQAVLDVLTKREVFIKDETASPATYKLRK